VDERAAADYVLHRLTEQGFIASPTSGGKADLMACTADAGRVALIRVRAREPNGRFVLRAEDRRPAGRNVSYVFADFGAGEGAEPALFVVRASLLLARLEVDVEWPRDARSFDSLEDCRDAWHRLGLNRASAVRSESVVSPC
jgi:hypothetical protein